jgi:hypothetical protein
LKDIEKTLSGKRQRRLPKVLGIVPLSGVSSLLFN